MRLAGGIHSAGRLCLGLCAAVAAVVGFPLAAASANLGGAAPALSQSSAGVGMDGTPFNTATLQFSPAHIAVHVGDVVRWTNQALVPHTATEDHGLWDLGGRYLGVGVAPNASVQRTFEAGTHFYYCKVHPKYMHGEIDVPVDLSVSSRTVRRGHHRLVVYTIHVRWDASAPASGLVFDVERGSGNGPLSAWITGTNAAGGSFTTTRRESVWHVRARLRRDGDPAAATGFSPDAVVVAR